MNSRNINLYDTSARNSGLVVLEKPIQVPEGHEAWIGIQDAQIPNTYYNVLTPGGTIDIPIRNTTTDTTTVASIAIGSAPSNFTVAQLVASIEGKTFTWAASGGVVLTFRCTLVNEDGSSTAAGTPATRAQVSPRIRLGLVSSIGTNYVINNFTSPLLGFVSQSSPAALLASSNPTAAQIANASMTATNPPFVASKFYLVASSLITGSQVPGLSTRIVPLGKVPVCTAFGFVDNYRQMVPFYQKLRDDSIQSFELSLYNEDGTPVHFRGMDWSLTLAIEFHHKKNTPLSNSTV